MQFSSETNPVITGFVFKALAIFLICFYVSTGISAVCSQAVGSCDFYQCLESISPCGDHGYAIHFGYKFCTKSENQLMQNMPDDQGRRWVLDTMKCLQQALSDQLDESEISCQKIKKTGYATHLGCYIQSGYCDLPKQDRSEIIKLLKFQLLKPQNIIQGIHLLQACKK